MGADARESAFFPTRTAVPGTAESISDIRRAPQSEPDDHVDAPGAAAPPPAFIGPFRILKAQARGGLGEVLLAHDPALGRTVALKRIRSDKRGVGELRERFLREAALTSQLEHPGIVPIHALALADDGRPYYVMRFIEGQTLAEAIAAHHRAPTPASLRSLLQRFVSVCQTVAYAHSKQIIHRDLKPANIMLGPYGETLILDWGLAKKIQSPERLVLSPEADAKRRLAPEHDAPTVVAKELSAPLSGLSAQDSRLSSSADEATILGGPELAAPTNSSLTQDGAVLGTPAYMAPEQAEGDLDQLGPGSDQYSLGAILYEMLAGRPPHRGQTIIELIEKLLAGKIEPPRKVKPGASRALEAVCLKALARRPADRYPSVAELSLEVDRWLAREPVQAFPEPWLSRLGRWVRRRRTAAVAAVAVLFVAALALGVGNLLLRRAADETLTERNAALAARDQAQAARDQAEAARVRAEAAMREAAAVTDFLVVDLFSQANPRMGQAAPSLKVALDRALAKAADTFAGQPLLEMRVRQAAAAAYRSLTENAAASSHIKRALALAQAHLPPENPERLDVEECHASQLAKQGENAIAAELMKELLPRFERTFGTGHRQTLRLRNYYGLVLTDLDRFVEAETQYRLAIAGWEADPELMRRGGTAYWTFRQNGAYLLTRQSKWKEALAEMDKCAEWFDRHRPPLDYARLNLRLYRATALMNLGRLDESAAILATDLALVEAAFGPTMDLTVQYYLNLGAVLLRQGKLAEADPVTKKAYELASKHETRDERLFSAAKVNRAGVLASQGRLAESAAVLRSSPQPQPTKPARP